MLRIKDKLKKIKNLITRLSPLHKKVKVIVVTRARTTKEIREAIDSGVEIIGETNLNEAEEKFVNWKGERKFKIHMLGPIQSNKTRTALQIFDCIQSVDSYKFADKISKIAGEMNKKMPVFIQINIAEKDGIPGIKPSLLASNLAPILNLKNLEVHGFNIMLPNDTTEHEARKYFKQGKKLARSFGLMEICATTNGDFPIAVEEGVDCVNVGRDIFEE